MGPLIYCYCEMTDHALVWIGTEWYFLPVDLFNGHRLHHGETVNVHNQEQFAVFISRFTPRWPEPQSFGA